MFSNRRLNHEACDSMCDTPGISLYKALFCTKPCHRCLKHACPGAVAPKTCSATGDIAKVAQHAKPPLQESPDFHHNLNKKVSSWMCCNQNQERGAHSLPAVKEVTPLPGRLRVRVVAGCLIWSEQGAELLLQVLHMRPLRSILRNGKSEVGASSRSGSPPRSPSFPWSLAPLGELELGSNWVSFRVV